MGRVSPGLGDGIVGANMQLLAGSLIRRFVASPRPRSNPFGLNVPGGSSGDAVGVMNMY